MIVVRLRREDRRMRANGKTKPAKHEQRYDAAPIHLQQNNKTNPNVIETCSNRSIGATLALPLCPLARLVPLSRLPRHRADLRHGGRRLDLARPVRDALGQRHHLLEHERRIGILFVCSFVCVVSVKLKSATKREISFTL